MCKWESKITNYECKRESIVSEEYCLFHKSNKSKNEQDLFRRIINFKIFSTRLVELRDKLYLTNFDSKCQALYDDEQRRILDLNFTFEEKQKQGFNENKQFLLDQYFKSEISWKWNISLPNFYWFVFPDTWIDNYKFEYMYNPYTDGTLVFNECVFEWFMNFSWYNFIGKTIFEKCDFRNNVIFTNSIFNKSVKFNNTNLNTSIWIMWIWMFENTRFLWKEAVFDNVYWLLEFDLATFSEKTDFQLLNMHYPTDYGTASYWEKAYRLAKIQSNRVWDYNKAADYYYLEKCYRWYQLFPDIHIWNSSNKWIRKIILFEYFKEKDIYNKLILKLMDCTFRISIWYWEKPINALISIIIIIIVFTFIYMFIWWLDINGVINNYNFSINKDFLIKEYWISIFQYFGNCLYFSIVTLTTVWYWDFKPVTWAAKFFAWLEMFLWVTFIWAWTATLLRKVIK